jgi:hypothetical protein
MKIDLEFNLESLKISDLPEDEQDHGGSAPRGTSSIIDNLKRKTTLQEAERTEPTEGAPVAKVRANVESSKLRELLNNINSNEE